MTASKRARDDRVGPISPVPVRPAGPLPSRGVQQDDTLRREDAVVDLGPDQCWERLNRSRTGRLAFLRDDRIEMFPVNYIADGRRIVFATSSTLILAAAEQNRPVVFEVDEHDGWTAWSVVLRGWAGRVADADPAGRRIRSMLPTRKEAHVVIEPTAVTGRLFDEAAP